MKRYLNNVHNITLQHDALEREAREMILANCEDRTMSKTGPGLDLLTKIVKAAFYAGQDSILAEINDDLPADAPKLSMCRCGYASCMDVQFSNMGKFTQGTGFSMREALRIQQYYADAERKPVIMSVDIETYDPAELKTYTPEDVEEATNNYGVIFGKAPTNVNGFDIPQGFRDFVKRQANRERIEKSINEFFDEQKKIARRRCEEAANLDDPWNKSEVEERNLKNRVRNTLSKRFFKADDQG